MYQYQQQQQYYPNYQYPNQQFNQQYYNPGYPQNQQMQFDQYNQNQYGYAQPQQPQQNQLPPVSQPLQMLQQQVEQQPQQQRLAAAGENHDTNNGKFVNNGQGFDPFVGGDTVKKDEISYDWVRNLFFCISWFFFQFCFISG